MTEQAHKYKKSTIIGVGADLPKSQKTNHYVDNDAFYEALVERKVLVTAAKKAGEPLPPISPYIAKCLFDTADNLSQKYQFRNYPFREDMVQDAVLHMMRYIDSFNTDFVSGSGKKNPFSYFTQTAYYSFLSTLDDERDYMASKFKMTLERIATQEVSEHDEDYHQMLQEENMPETEMMSDFVRKYEVTREKRRAKKEQESPLEDFME